MLSRLAAAVSVLAMSSLTVSAWWQPKPGTSYQIQLNGELDLSYDVDMYDIDLFDTPNDTIAELQARGIKVVCYFSAGTYEDWRSDAGLYTDAMIGEALPEWKGEYWIDTTSEELRAILVTRMELAQAKGCDGVDPDNVDGAFNDSGFNLTNATQLDFNRFLADTAHSLNLTVGLKNDLDQIEQLVTEFDFAVNEQCVENDECDVLVPFVEHDKPVFGIEYDGDKTKGCATANALDFDTLYMDMNLDGSRYSCREEDGSSSESVASGSTDSSSSGDSSSTGSNLSSERPLLSTLSLLLMASAAVAVSL